MLILRSLTAIVLLAAFSGELRAETCVSDSLGLQRTSRLEVLQSFFGTNETGLVNETEGTFVVIDFSREKATIALYTSGLFDLSAIKRESEIQFCDLGDKVVMRGLDREEDVKLENGKLVVGAGGPKKTFAKGAMPSKLVSLHHYTPKRSVAGQARPEP